LIVVMNVVSVKDENARPVRKGHRHSDGELAFDSRVRNYEVIDTRVAVS